jgi:hypothetical protein
VFVSVFYCLLCVCAAIACCFELPCLPCIASKLMSKMCHLVWLYGILTRLHPFAWPAVVLDVWMVVENFYNTVGLLLTSMHVLSAECLSAVFGGFVAARFSSQCICYVLLGAVACILCAPLANLLCHCAGDLYLFLC